VSQKDDAPDLDDGDPEVARRLSGMVEAEARRMLSEAQLAPDPERVAAGWERRFIADATRTPEVVTLYESLGFEVAADPIRRDDLPDGCDDCQLAQLLGFRTVYTRKTPRRTNV
jgi:hypothetical protein